MKVEGGRSIGSATGPRRAGSAAAPGFAVPAEGPQKAAAATPSSAITPLHAILALQIDEPPSRRRARQAKRGQDALDVLEKLERGLVMGHAPGSLRADLEALQKGAEATGDDSLDEVLREIDIRLAVEAAKLDRMLGKA